MAGSASGSGATVTVRSAGAKENYSYMSLIGGSYAHPFHPGPCDLVDVDRGIQENSVFDVSHAHRQSFHLALDFSLTHPPGAQAWGRSHKSADFKNAVRFANDLVRCFGAMAEAAYTYHKFGTTIKGGANPEFKQAPVVACVSAIRSEKDWSKIVGVGLHLFIHKERDDVLDADIEEEKARYDMSPDAPFARRPPPSKLQKWADKITDRDRQRVPVKALDHYLMRNSTPITKGGGFHSAGRSVAAPTDRAAASQQTASSDHPDRVSRSRYNDAARWLTCNWADEKQASFNELCNLPLEDRDCVVAPGLVFSLDEFKRSVLKMNGQVEWSQDGFVIEAGDPEFLGLISAWHDVHPAAAADDVPDSFESRFWRSVDGFDTPVFPFKGSNTWRVSPEHFFPGRFDLCYFPWVPRLSCSEETGEFKKAVANFYPSVCLALQVDPIEQPNHAEAMAVCKRRAHELLDPRQVSAAGVDDLETARNECTRIMADSEMHAGREIEAEAKVEGKISDARAFQIRAIHRRAAQLNAVGVLARVLHQDADMPDAVIALVRWADKWRVTHKNFSLKSIKVTRNLTWFGEILALENASHEVFFNEYIGHKPACIADKALQGTYLMRKLNLNAIFWGTQGAAKSFLLTCAETRWIDGTWSKFQERSDASHRIASNKGCHMMMEMTEELDPSDVGVVGSAGMSKAMMDTAQTKRACSIRDQETSQQRVFEHKDRVDGVGPWQVYSVKMRAQIGKVACTNMSPSMIPANSADRKCFVHVVKRDKKDETLKDKTTRKMPEYLVAAKKRFIDFSNRNQFLLFCIGQIIDLTIIKDIDESVGNDMLVRMLRDAGDAGVQKTDSIRDMDRVKLVAAVNCVLDKATQLLDLPFNGSDEEMTIEQLLVRLLDIEPHLVVQEEHMAAAWSLLDVQYEDPLIKPILDGLLRWQGSSEKGTPLMDSKGRPYQIFDDDATIDITGTREQRAVRQQRIEAQAAKVAAKRKLKGTPLSPAEQKAALEDMQATGLFDDGDQARDQHLRPSSAESKSGGGARQKKSAAAAAAKNGEVEPGQKVLNFKGVDKLAPSEFVQFLWEEKDPQGRARRLADCVYNFIPGKTKPSLESIVDSCYNLLRMVILLPGGIHALAVNVKRDGNGVCCMALARVLLETNVAHKTRCFLENALLRPHVPAQTFVFCYPYHDRPHIWHTWYNDVSVDWVKNKDERRLWFRKHEKEILQRRRDEDIILASKLLGIFREQFADLTDAATWTAACKHGREAKTPVDPDDEDGEFNETLRKLWLVASNETSDGTLWRNVSFVDSSTRRLASKYSVDPQQPAAAAAAVRAPAFATAGIAPVVKETPYMLITEPPGELALAERLFAIRWDVKRVRELIQPTAEETRYLEESDDFGNDKAAFDAFRVKLARVWLSPILCQHMINRLYNRAGLRMYPLDYDILDDSYDISQRKTAKASADRLVRSTSLRMHGLYAIMDEETAREMPLAKTFKDQEQVYHRSVEAKRVSGRKQEGYPLPIPNRVIRPQNNLLLVSEPRDMFDLLVNWKEGVFRMSESDAYAGIEPPRAPTDAKEAKRRALVQSPTRSPARQSRGSKRKSPSTAVKGSGRGGKRPRRDEGGKEAKGGNSDDNGDDDEGPDEGKAAKPAASRSLFGNLRKGRDDSSPGLGLGGQQQMQLDDDEDKENKDPRPGRRPPPMPRAPPAAAAAAAAAADGSAGMAAPTSTNALHDLMQQQQQISNTRHEASARRVAARKAAEADAAATRALQEKNRQLFARVDIEEKRAAVRSERHRIVDDRSDGEIKAEAALDSDFVIKVGNLGKKRHLQRIGADRLVLDADSGLSAKERARASKLMESTAGQGPDEGSDGSASEDESGKKKKKKKSKKKAAAPKKKKSKAAAAANESGSDNDDDESEAEPDSDEDAAPPPPTQDADGDVAMPPAGEDDDDETVRKGRGGGKLKLVKSKKDLRKERLGAEGYKEYSAARKAKKQAAAAAKAAAIASGEGGVGSGGGPSSRAAMEDDGEAEAAFQPLAPPPAPGGGSEAPDA